MNNNSRDPSAAALKRYPQTILASAVIPWTEKYELDQVLFCREIKAIIDRGVRHIYLFGTAGEGYAVTDRQYDEIVRIFAEEMKGPDLFPMVGIISLSLQVILQRIETAYGYGIRDFQISLPSWGELTDEEMNVFFHEVCDPFPDCRFIHYNLMRSKRLITVKEYEKLAERFPNLAGAKFCSNDFFIIRDIAASTCPLQFFVGEAALLYGNLLGECGLLIAVGNCNIRRTTEFYNAVIEGDSEKSLQFTKELLILHKGLSICCTGRRIDGAYDKLYAKLIDPEFPLRLLPPYQGFDDDVFFKYRDYVKRNCPQWLEPQSL